MFNIIIRVLIIYVIVIFVMRLMGKRQIGELEPFELVITLIIADLATIPMAEQTIPLWYGVIPLLVICVIHFAVTGLTKLCPVLRDVISGKPVIVVDENGIVFKELKKLNISAEELIEALRNLDYFDLSDVGYAIIERNGKISVIPKAAGMPMTREDNKIKVEENDVFFAIIENGKLLKKNFAELDIPNKAQYDVVVSRILHKIGCGMRDIAFASMTAGGDVYYQQKGKSARTLTVEAVA